MKITAVDFNNARSIIHGFEQFEDVCIIYQVNRKFDLGVVKVYKAPDDEVPIACFCVSKKDLFTLLGL